MTTRPIAQTNGRRPAWLTGLGVAALALFAVGAWLGLVVSPVDVNQGDLIRIMYPHVAVAWICFVAVAVAAVFGMLYLWHGKRRDDIWAVSAAEGATFFAALTIVGGMTYSKPTLNTFWTWDAKLTLTALLLALLVGYFIVRALVDDPQRRGRISAVILIVVLASLPLNYLAAEWFRTLHPAKSLDVTGGGITMQAEFLRILLFNVVAAGVAFAWFLLERVRIGRLEVERERASEDAVRRSGEVVRV
jgi:heme exporter protein C